MLTGTLKKLALALTFWLAVHMPSLKAQILGPDTNTSGGTVTFGFDAYGVLWNAGVGSATLSLHGAGTRMFWYPGKAAFRAGKVDGTQWDDSTTNPNIGQYSVAFGMDTTASDDASMAFGWLTTASGPESFAFGTETTASGANATAFGFASQAIGPNSIAAGTESGATGNCSLAFGFDTSASANYSMAFGRWTSASGYFSTASGEGTSASGTYSTASGEGTSASGTYSTASGYGTQANSYMSFVIGSMNAGTPEDNPTGTPNPTAWVQTDPLFEVGNGGYSTPGNPSLYGNPDATGPSDAFVVYKNGDTAAQGTISAPNVVITAPNGNGDIPMYTGNGD